MATDRAVDLIEEKVDVAIRARTRLDDETLPMRRLGSSTLVFVASPDFVIGTRSWLIHLISQVFHFSAFRKIRPGQVGL
jgi:DNA-binding transcriptional LysR family regulator